MNKGCELPVVSVRLAPNHKLHSETIIRNSIDVPFLFGEELKKYKRDVVMIASVNTIGQTTNLTVATLPAFQENIKDVSECIILNNACATFFLTNAEIDETVLQKYIDISVILGIPVLDCVSIQDEDMFSYKGKEKLVGSYDGFVRYDGNENVQKIDYESSIRLVTDRTIFFEGNTENAIRLIASEMALYDRENLCVLSLDGDDKPINLSTISIGDLISSTAHPREAMKAPLLSEAKKIILLHNHPSEDNTPSNADLAVTARFMDAAQLLRIEVEDHIIVAGRTGNTYSMKEHYDLDDTNMAMYRRVIHGKAR